MRVVLDGETPVQEKTDRKTGRIYRYPVAAGKVPEDWWTDIETLNHSDRERTGWPSQKPERLIERIVCATTAPGDVVADWFAGSGTTAAVAHRLGRRYLVAEAEAAAVEIIYRRLDPRSAGNTRSPRAAGRAGRASAGDRSRPRDTPTPAPRP